MGWFQRLSDGLGKTRSAVKQSLDRYPQGRMAEDSQFGLARSYEALKQTDAALNLYGKLAANRASSGGCSCFLCGSLF